MKLINQVWLGMGMFLSISSLQGAIGCQKIEHTVRYWNESAPKYVKCSCPCRNTTPHKGRCRRCSHYGNPERGNFTKAVEQQEGVFRY